jgi:hypothetical protein
MTSLAAYKTYIPVKEASAFDSCRVDVLFANGERARVDFSEIIGQGPWKRLADPSFFKLAHADYDTVVWNDDVDVSPEFVWEKAHLATEFSGVEPNVPLS